MLIDFIPNELFKYRTASYEIGDNLDNVLKKNKSFQEEIIDLQALVQKGIKDGQDNEKSKREIDQERGDLQHQLQEAEAAIQAQESKFLKVQIELSQMQQTSERRLNEKEEDIDNARRIATKSIEQEKVKIRIISDSTSFKSYDKWRDLNVLRNSQL